jgi:hypothetical protein
VCHESCGGDVCVARESLETACTKCDQANEIVDDLINQKAVGRCIRKKLIFICLMCTHFRNT